MSGVISSLGHASPGKLLLTSTAVGRLISTTRTVVSRTDIFHQEDLYLYNRPICHRMDSNLVSCMSRKVCRFHGGSKHKNQ